MIIDEAIKILRPKMIRANQAEDFDYGDAIKLGIEALKRIIEKHEDDELLPSETTD